MNIIANTAAKKLNTVNAIAAIDVPPYNSVISITCPGVKGIDPEALNIPVSVLITGIVSRLMKEGYNPATRTFRD